MGFPSMDRVWSRVEARLDEDERDKQEKIIPFRKASWRKGMAAAVLVLLGMGLTYILGRWKADPAPQHYVQEKPQPHQPKPSELQRKPGDTPVLVQATDKPGPVLKPRVARRTQAKPSVATNHSAAPVVMAHADRTASQPAAERSASAIATTRPGGEDKPTHVYGPRTINGQVLDVSGESAVGAAIKIKGTTTGTVTDVDGRYTLQVPAGASTLEMSSLTGETKEIDISKAEGYLVTTLEPGSTAIDEIQIYGQAMSTKAATGSVATITSKEIEKRPVTDVSKVLEGSTPGINAQLTGGRKQSAAQEQVVASNSSRRKMTLPENESRREKSIAINSGGGQPGASPAVAIRGLGSLSAGSSPLIVLDGVVYNGDLTNIDPKDIADVSVLKDAAATAIYGARGANGVILITTKAYQRQHRSFPGRTWGKVKQLFKGKKTRHSSVAPAAADH